MRADHTKHDPMRTCVNHLVSQHAQSIYQQVVVSKIMPMNNATGITDAERLLVKQWFEAGAKVD